jgi:hypothetical protein
MRSYLIEKLFIIQPQVGLHNKYHLQQLICCCMFIHCRPMDDARACLLSLHSNGWRLLLSYSVLSCCSLHMGALPKPYRRIAISFLRGRACKRLWSSLTSSLDPHFNCQIQMLVVIMDVMQACSSLLGVPRITGRRARIKPVVSCPLAR